MGVHLEKLASRFALQGINRFLDRREALQAKIVGFTRQLDRREYKVWIEMRGCIKRKKTCRDKVFPRFMSRNDGLPF